MRRAKAAARRPELQRFSGGLGQTGGVEPAVLVHAPQHHLLPVLRFLGRDMRVEFARVTRQPREKRSFRDAQIGGWFAKVVIGRGGEPKVEIAEVDAIQVGAQNLIFRPELFEAERGDALD